MATDHYVAICNPLPYITVMNHRHCILLLILPFCIPQLLSLLHILLTNHLTFCASNVIDHFFCYHQLVLKLSRSSHFVKKITVMTDGLVVIMTPFSCIIVSHLKILITVLKIPSAAGK